MLLHLIIDDHIRICNKSLKMRIELHVCKRLSDTNMTISNIKN